MSYVYDVMDSPVGPLTLVASEEGLCGVYWDKQPGADWKRDARHRTLAMARAQLSEYFDGDRTEFELPLAPEGTEFQRQVWLALRSIPYGETISYGAQAKRIGRPKASRAVGAANGKNPISIVVPCHRVIGASGALTGFGGGIDAKKYLLELEKRHR